MPKNYILQIKVQNAKLLRAMRRKGIFNTAELSRATGVAYPVICALLNLKKPPTKKLSGDWCEPVMKIAKYLNTMPVDLFPRDLLTIPRGKGVAEVEVSLDELLALEADPTSLEQKVIQHQTEKTILDYADELPPRHTRVLRMLYGIGCSPYTLEQCAEKMNVSRERIRQIQNGAIRKLKIKIITHNNTPGNSELKLEYV